MVFHYPGVGQAKTWDDPRVNMRHDPGNTVYAVTTSVHCSETKAVPVRGSPVQDSHGGRYTSRSVPRRVLQWAFCTRWTVGKQEKAVASWHVLTSGPVRRGGVHMSFLPCLQTRLTCAKLMSQRLTAARSPQCTQANVHFTLHAASHPFTQLCAYQAQTEQLPTPTSSNVTEL